MNNEILSRSLRVVCDFVYPRLCAVCKRRLSLNERAICPTCFHNMPVFLNHPVYSTERIEGEAYIETFDSLFCFKDGNATQRAIHQLKYNRYKDVGKLFGKLAAKKFRWSNCEVDWILPVPISRKRRAFRGYNQAMIIAEGISQHTGIKASDSILARKIEFYSQTKRDKVSRQKAVKNKFYCKRPQLLRNKSVLIVDDVLTSGATLAEVASVISRAGANHIKAFTAAVAK